MGVLSDSRNVGRPPRYPTEGTIPLRSVGGAKPQIHNHLLGLLGGDEVCAVGHHWLDNKLVLAAGSAAGGHERVQR